MSNITLSQIQQDPLDFARRIEAGESMLILKGGQALAEIKPIANPCATERPYGLADGEFTVPTGFDDPLPDEILREFEGA
jgi:antitoxin (DNA-binding transcriptional repressor) of toxin-antitoxin stability system